MTTDDVTNAPAWERIDPYEEWRRDEEVTKVYDLYIKDLYNLEVGPWPRRGCNGAVLYMDGDDGSDEHLLELPPAGKTIPERHRYKESICVLTGRGATSVWYDDGRKQTFEWAAGSFFTIPLNAWCQYFNGSGSESARLISVTNLPSMLRQFVNRDFIWDNPFTFNDRMTSDEGWFSGEGNLYKGRIWETNFVPDAASMKLHSWAERGAGGINVMLSMGDNMMASHISQMPSGTYKKGHKHGSGAHLLVVGGVGFSLLWQKDDASDMIKADWQVGSMYLSGGGGGGLWFHQHFNTGPEPARYLVMGAGNSRKYVGQRGGTQQRQLADVSIKEGGWQVEYGDEDPQVHAIYEEELAKHGGTCLMKNLSPYCTGMEGPTDAVADSGP